MFRRAALAPLLAVVLVGAPLLGSTGDGQQQETSGAVQRPTAAAPLRDALIAAPQGDVDRAVAVSEAEAGVVQLAAVPRTVTRSGAYAFLNVSSGRPTRWNPCAPVPWVFNAAGAPAGGLSAVRSALAEISRRTGLRFRYLGTTRTTPTAAHLRQTWRHFRPLLIGWTTSRQSDLLRGHTARTVGMTRVLWTGSYDARGVKHTQIASGVIAFNRATRARATGPGSWYTYALHEIGHAVGLAHVADRTQIMNPTISGTLRGYGVGDATGLRRVGRTSGCLPAIR